MLFVAIFSLALGFLLNEEACLNRVCRNLAYPHEGWLLINSDRGVLIIAAACVFAFLKGCAAVHFLGPYYGETWFLPSGLYFMGNVLAVKRVRGLFYTPWFALLGVMYSGELKVFQGVFTVVVVSALVTRNPWVGTRLWQPAFFLLVLLYARLPEGLFWIGIIAAARTISGRQSPFTDKLIRYFGKISGWRVTT